MKIVSIVDLIVTSFLVLNDEVQIGEPRKFVEQRNLGYYNILVKNKWDYYYRYPGDDLDRRCFPSPKYNWIYIDLLLPQIKRDLNTDRMWSTMFAIMWSIHIRIL